VQSGRKKAVALRKGVNTSPTKKKRGGGDEKGLKDEMLGIAVFVKRKKKGADQQKVYLGGPVGRGPGGKKGDPEGKKKSRENSVHLSKGTTGG